MTNMSDPQETEYILLIRSHSTIILIYIKLEIHALRGMLRKKIKYEKPK